MCIRGVYDTHPWESQILPSKNQNFGNKFLLYVQMRCISDGLRMESNDTTISDHEKWASSLFRN